MYQSWLIFLRNGKDKFHNVIKGGYVLPYMKLYCKDFTENLPK